MSYRSLLHNANANFNGNIILKEAGTYIQFPNGTQMNSAGGGSGGGNVFTNVDNVFLASSENTFNALTTFDGNVEINNDTTINGQVDMNEFTTINGNSQFNGEITINPSTGINMANNATLQFPSDFPPSYGNYPSGLGLFYNNYGNYEVDMICYGNPTTGGIQNTGLNVNVVSKDQQITSVANFSYVSTQLGNDGYNITLDTSSSTGDLTLSSGGSSTTNFIIDSGTSDLTLTGTKIILDVESTAPTPIAGDDSTKIATTAFVQTELSNITGYAQLDEVNTFTTTNIFDGDVQISGVFLVDNTKTNIGQLTGDGVNTSIGGNSLQSVTTGEANTSFGGFSLSLLTTGIDNTSCGYNGLNSCTIGSFNTAVGFSTLLDTTTGDANTAIGYQAGENNTGSNNTYLGSNATQPPTDTTSYSQLTLIGANTIPVVEGQNNQVVLGRDTDNVYIPSSSINLGVNTSSNLYVSGNTILSQDLTFSSASSSIVLNDTLGFQNSNATSYPLQLRNASAIEWYLEPTTNPVNFYLNFGGMSINANATFISLNATSSVQVSNILTSPNNPTINTTALGSGRGTFYSFNKLPYFTYNDGGVFNNYSLLTDSSQFSITSTNTSTNSWSFTIPNNYGYGFTYNLYTTGVPVSYNTGGGTSPNWSAGTITLQNNSIFFVNGNSLYQPYTSTSSTFVDYCSGGANNHTATASGGAYIMNIISSMGGLASWTISSNSVTTTGKNPGDTPCPAQASSNFTTNYTITFTSSLTTACSAVLIGNIVIPS